MIMAGHDEDFGDDGLDDDDDYAWVGLTPNFWNTFVQIFHIVSLQYDIYPEEASVSAISLFLKSWKVAWSASSWPSATAFAGITKYKLDKFRNAKW